MAQELSYRAGAAAGYDRAFGSISGQFIPALLRAARVGPGYKVLDVATGTGAAAEAATDAVGPSGVVVATDLSPAMLAKASGRLSGKLNVSLAVEDGQSLTFPDRQFDAVLCAMGLMLFPDPARGLSEFRRVLREGRWAAVSVNTVPERAFATRVDAIVGHYWPERAALAARYFSLGDAGHLRSLFTAAGFQQVETFTETRRYPFRSFGAYFKSIEEGHGEPGQAFVALPTEIQRLVREDVRRQLEGDTVAGGPVEVDVELLFGCGRR
ncbi:MAG TPA: methyltransferase domain-containing protein [Acetobacteraceae bacterium]|nr:methyltransferase domain-containing protein [Acetobacteraceae bacterium]